MKTELSKKQKKKKGKCEVQPEPVVVPLNKKERNNKKKQAKTKTNKPAAAAVNTKLESTITPAKKETVPETNKTVTQKQPGTTLNLQMLRLPPGITITKVDGPAVNRKLSFSVSIYTYSLFQIQINIVYIFRQQTLQQKQQILYLLLVLPKIVLELLWSIQSS